MNQMMKLSSMANGLTTTNALVGDRYQYPNTGLGEYVWGWWIIDIDGDQIVDMELTQPIGTQMAIGPTISSKLKMIC